MNNDRHHDQQVSAAYQDLAKERTPEHLDRDVLRMAKASTERPQYSRWTAWSRPLAWAATVALCLAITLEVTQVTPLDNVVAESSREELAAPASLMVPELQEDKLQQMLEKDMEQQSELSDSMADAISSEKISPARSAAKRTANEPAAAARMRQSAYLVEEERIGEVTVAAGMSASECAEEARSEPESWLECIKALEASGDVEAAARQREILIEVFPDFNLP